MPGHIKLGKSGEPDPDPTPYLVVSMEMKRADMLKPYDPKKSYYCPDGNGGFKECLLVESDGAKATVMIGHEVKYVRFCPLNFLLFNSADVSRKKSSKRRKLGKSIHPSLRSVKTWQI